MTTNSTDKLTESLIRLYETEAGKVSVEVKMEDGTLWLNQKQMAELFECSVMNISLHLKYLYQESELEEIRTIKEYFIVQEEGHRAVTRGLLFYNLDAIIAVGYRINSKKGTQFSKWATSILNEYLAKGYSFNERGLIDEKLQRLQAITESLFENSAVLLCSVIKNHPFVDGNKRIGAILFLHFLNKAGLLKDSMNQNSLIAITLLVATSNPGARDLMINLVMKLILL